MFFRVETLDPTCSYLHKLVKSQHLPLKYNKFLQKIHLKKEDISNIQQTLKAKKSSSKKKLDWHHWQQDLKARGVPAREIEAVFAKYDIDGDMVLDDEEQRLMEEDLKKQKYRHEVRVSKLKAMDSDLQVKIDDAGQGSFIDHNEVKFKLSNENYNNSVTQQQISSVNSRLNCFEKDLKTTLSKIESLFKKVEQVGQDLANSKNSKDLLEKEKLHVKESSRALPALPQIIRPSSTVLDRPNSETSWVTETETSNHPNSSSLSKKSSSGKLKSSASNRQNNRKVSKFEKRK